MRKTLNANECLVQFGRIINGGPNRYVFPCAIYVWMRERGGGCGREERRIRKWKGKGERKNFFMCGFTIVLPICYRITWLL